MAFKDFHLAKGDVVSFVFTDEDDPDRYIVIFAARELTEWQAAEVCGWKTAVLPTSTAWGKARRLMEPLGPGNNDQLAILPVRSGCTMSRRSK